MYYFKYIINNIKYFSFFLLGSFIVISVYQYSNLIGLNKIKNVKVYGNRFIESKIIEKMLDISPEDNLINFDSKEVQEKIIKIEFIKSCRISKIFPSTLVIEIIENDLIANIITPNEKFILDKSGTLLKLDEAAIKYFILPTVNINKHSLFNKMEFKEFALNISNEMYNLREKYPEIFYGIKFFNFVGHGDVFIDFSENTQIIVKENNLRLHFDILNEFKSIKYRLDDYLIIDLRVDNQLIVKENII